MIEALNGFTRALLILNFRVFAVLFFLLYPILKLVWGILKRPWLRDPIIQGVALTLAPLRDLRHRIPEKSSIENEADRGSPRLLPAPSPPKRDINLATVEELRGIEGVGFVRALEIVEYRERFGQYRRMEELGLIRGIGAQTLKLLSETYEAIPSS